MSDFDLDIRVVETAEADVAHETFTCICTPLCYSRNCTEMHMGNTQCIV